MWEGGEHITSMRAATDTPKSDTTPRNIYTALVMTWEAPRAPAASSRNGHPCGGEIHVLIKWERGEERFDLVSAILRGEGQWEAVNSF